ncbi:hypothetical protein BD311DRAFT_799794 [Dichomitus squalens]|uniref:Uncharacterized protein n=1 Tax=Dichomitus squalens TaxID=114155 RepID=A0A4V2JZ97_9APHY|nr:hypothetical protein BD311DRAFT_799794 [Dichomitus squalens]
MPRPPSPVQLYEICSRGTVVFFCAASEKCAGCVRSGFTVANESPDYIDLEQEPTNVPFPSSGREAAEEAHLGQSKSLCAGDGQGEARSGQGEFHGTQFGRDLDTDTDVVVHKSPNEALSNWTPSFRLQRSLVLYLSSCLSEYLAFTAFIEPESDEIIFQPFVDHRSSPVIHVRLTRKQSVGEAFMRSELEIMPQIAEERKLVSCPMKLYSRVISPPY